jgi:NitT/TauT family transport system permease protein
MNWLDRLLAPSRARSVILVLLAVPLAWQLATTYFAVPVYILPAPSDIIGEIASAPGWYARHALFTVESCLLGFALALLVGVVAAVGIVYSPLVEHTVYTLLVSLNSIPKIALAPLFIIWMGTGMASKVAISALIALFTIVIDTVLGLRSADPEALDLSRSLRATPLQMLLTIRFPTALPAMFAGMKVAISLALVGAIAGEFVASEAGLGYVILVAQGMFQTTRVFASLILLGLLGTALFYVVDLAERLLIPWHVSQRVAETGGGHAG